MNHLQSSKHAKRAKEEGNVGPKISSFNTSTIDDRRKNAELKIAAFIAQLCSTRAVNDLGEMIQNLDTKSEVLTSIKLHKTKCLGLIHNFISPCILEELIEDIGNSYYSKIIDESTSIDTKKVLSLVIRYFSRSKLKIVTTFYRLVEIESGDHKSMVDTFVKILSDNGLKIQNLIGIGVDGANVMVGKYNSFSSKLKEILPNLIVVKCVCHSIHLAAEKAFLKLPQS